MTVIPYPQTVYVIDGDTALSHSVRFLLETHQFVVKTVASTAALAKLPSLRENDIILMDLDKSQPTIYRLLNELLLRARRPGIVLTTALKSALRPDDTFKGDRIKVLVHPVAPKILLETVDTLCEPKPA